MSRQRSPKRPSARPAPVPALPPAPPTGAVWRRAALALAFALPLALYAVTAGRSVFWQDAGAFHAAIHGLGVLFHPGFPIYELLARGFTAALGVLDFTYAVHLFSGVCGALASLLVGAAVLRLTARRSPAAALLASLAFGGSYSLWMQATNAEAYALHAALTAGLLALLLRAWDALAADDERRARRALLGALALFGASGANHPMAAFNVVAVAVGLWGCRRLLRRRGVALGGAGVFVASGFLPYLALPLFAARDPSLVMGDVGSVRAFLRHIVASDFVGRESTFTFVPSRIPEVGREILLNVMPAGLALAAAGLGRLRGRRAVAALLGALWLPVSVLVLCFRRPGEFDMYLIVTYVPLTILVGLGAERLFARVGGGRRRALTVGVAFAATLAPMLVVNVPLLDRRHDRLPEIYGQNLLRNLDPGAILVIRGDSSSATVAYLQEVKGYRTDVTVVQAAYLPSGWYRRHLARRSRLTVIPEAGTVTEEAALGALLAAHGDARPVFLSQARRDLTTPGFIQYPAGTAQKLVRAAPDGPDLRYWRYELPPGEWWKTPMRSHGERDRRLPDGRVEAERVPYLKDMVDFHAQAHVNLGTLRFAARQYAEAAVHFARARELVADADAAPVQEQLAEAWYAAEDPRARAALEDAVARDPRFGRGLLYLGELARRAGDDAQARALYERAAAAAPELTEVVAAVRARLGAPTAGPGGLTPGGTLR